MLSSLRRTALVARPLRPSRRALSAPASLAKNQQLPPRRKVDEADIEEKFLKGSGPGGQKINKTNSAVQLQHGPSGLVVKCQATRSRDQNRKIARQLLAEKLEEVEKGEESRTKIKEKVKSRKKASAAKKSKRKYRALEEEQGKGQGDAAAGDEESGTFLTGAGALGDAGEGHGGQEADAEAAKGKD